MGVLSNETVNASVDALTALANLGFLRIYSGPIPEECDDPAGAGSVLAEFALPDPAFAAAVDGYAAMDCSPPLEDASAANSGVATWYRVFKADGTSPLWQGQVGATGSGKSVEVNTVNIQAGAVVTLTAFTVLQPKG